MTILAAMLFPLTIPFITIGFLLRLIIDALKFGYTELADKVINAFEVK